MTEGVQIGTTDMPIIRARERLRTHVKRVAQTMEEQQDLARCFLHRDMENASTCRHPWVEIQLEIGSIYKVVKAEGEFQFGCRNGNDQCVG